MITTESAQKKPGKAIPLIIASLAVALLPCACQIKPQPQWTLAFYLAGDNSLERRQVEHLRQLVNGAVSVRDANIIVLLDRDDSTAKDSPATAWKGTRAFEIPAGRAAISKPLATEPPDQIPAARFGSLIAPRIPADSIILKAYRQRADSYRLRRLAADERTRLRQALIDCGYLLPLDGERPVNLDASAPDTIRQFACLVQDSYPAAKTCLFITGHANGWFVEDARPPEDERRYADEYHADFEMANIKAALEHARPDVLVLDTCLSADLESLWTLRDAANYIVLHQNAIPSMGTDYRIFFELAGNMRNRPPEDLARAAVEACRRTYADEQYAVRTTAFATGRRLTEFVGHFNSLAAAKGLPPELDTRSLPYAICRDKNRVTMADLFSLIRLLGWDELEPYLPGGTLSFVVDSFGVNTRNRGLSIYLPRSGAYWQDLAAYRASDFARDFPQGWFQTLEVFYAQGEQTP